MFYVTTVQHTKSKNKRKLTLKAQGLEKRQITPRRLTLTAVKFDMTAIIYTIDN